MRLMRSIQALFPLEPQYRERVWGGQRLRAQHPPIGEVWTAFEHSRVTAGPQCGRTIGELATELNGAFLGRDVARRFPARFPLLIKLLDCADWLSVQVHPDDAQAARMVGEGSFGKTEAWHLLDVERDARILAGVKPGTSQDRLATAIRAGHDILNVAQSHVVREGETYFLPAGTLHALGPGLLLYEVQQSSDTTYRVYDWGRRADLGRPLHVEESVAVTDARRTVTATPPASLVGTAAAQAAACPFFTLDVVQVAGDALAGDTGDESFHVVTATAGSVTIRCGTEELRLDQFESALIAGSAGVYELRNGERPATLLRARVPAAASS
jgi:mannose-6-phosphate isomerase